MVLLRTHHFKHTCTYTHTHTHNHTHKCTHCSHRYKPSTSLLRLLLLHTHVALHSTALEWGIVDENGRNSATAAAASAAAAAAAVAGIHRRGFS